MAKPKFRSIPINKLTDPYLQWARLYIHHRPERISVTAPFGLINDPDNYEVEELYQCWTYQGLSKKEWQDLLKQEAIKRNLPITLSKQDKELMRYRFGDFRK